MLIQIFDIQDKKVVPSATGLMVPEIAALVKKFPTEYLKVMAYICFTTCPDGTNPYVNMDETTKEECIISDIKPFKFSLENPAILKAQEKCRLLYETPVLRTFRGAKKMLDKIGKFLDETEVTTGKEGSSGEIRAMMKELSIYWESYNKLELVLKEEQAKVRGNSHVPYWQKTGYKDLKEDE